MRMAVASRSPPVAVEKRAPRVSVDASSGVLLRHDAFYWSVCDECGTKLAWFGWFPCHSTFLLPSLMLPACLAATVVETIYTGRGGGSRGVDADDGSGQTIGCMRAYRLWSTSPQTTHCHRLCSVATADLCVTMGSFCFVAAASAVVDQSVHDAGMIDERGKGAWLTS